MSKVHGFCQISKEFKILHFVLLKIAEKFPQHNRKRFNKNAEGKFVKFDPHV